MAPYNPEEALEPPTPVLKSIADTNGRRTAVRIGGVLQYRLEVYCGVSLSPKFRSQQGTALQMGGRGVLWYKLEPPPLEVYCQYFSDKLYGLEVPEQFPVRAARPRKMGHCRKGVLTYEPLIAGVSGESPGALTE